jgi:hypothetical protein
VSDVYQTGAFATLHRLKTDSLLQIERRPASYRHGPAPEAVSVTHLLAELDSLAAANRRAPSLRARKEADLP